MRTTRRNSHIAAPRRTALAAAVLAAAALGTSACASAGSAPIAPMTMASAPGSSAPAGVTDIQILNSLEMTPDALNAAFGSNNAWRSWSRTTQDNIAIGYTGFLICKAGLASDDAALAPAVTTFSADSLPSDGTSGSPSSPGKTPKKTSPAGVPDHWVISIAAVFKTTDAAKSAAMSVGKLDASNSDCGKSSDGGNPAIPYIGGQIGETEPTWYGEDPVIGFAVRKSNYVLNAVAQQRGRFVVVTLTPGAGSLSGGYYTLNSLPDTDSAAEAATSLLSQLTNAVVNGS